MQAMSFYTATGLAVSGIAIKLSTKEISGTDRDKLREFINNSDKSDKF